MPDAFGDWNTFADYVDFLRRTRSVVEYTQVWWSVRPHLSFGTVEVRICDAQCTAGESDELAALIVACVAQAARDVDEHVPFTEQVKGALMFEVFNVLNSQWTTGVNTLAFTATSGVLHPVPGVGQANAAVSYPYPTNARSCQVAFRVTF